MEHERKMCNFLLELLNIYAYRPVSFDAVAPYLFRPEGQCTGWGLILSNYYKMYTKSVH